MLLPWVVNRLFAADTPAHPHPESARILSSSGCYDNPSHLFHVAELGIELTLFAIIVMTLFHLFRIAQQRQIAAPRFADSLGHAPSRSGSRYSRRRS